MRGVPRVYAPLETLAPPVQGGDVVPERRWSKEAFEGRRLHAPAPAVVLLPIHQEPNAVIELTVAERVVLPPEQLQPSPGVPREVAVGHVCGGPEEARPPPRRLGQAGAGGRHRVHGGSRLPQAARPPLSAAGAALVSDDS